MRQQDCALSRVTRVSRKKATELRYSTSVRAVSDIAFIKIRLLYALEDDFAIADFVRQMKLKEGAQFQVVDRAAFHCLQIGSPVNVLPVHHTVEVLFQHHVQPDTGGATISFTEGMGDIHLHILGDDFLGEKCSKVRIP